MSNTSPESGGGLEVIDTSEGKSGLAFNLLVSPATSSSPLKRASPRSSQPPGSPRSRSTTLQDITDKLKAAEERRKSIEGEKLDDLAKRRRKAQEVQATKVELNESFKEKTAEQLEQKMEAKKENKEAQIQEMITKLKLHDARINKGRQQVEAALQDMSNKLKVDMEERHANAEKRRMDQISECLDKLREHDSHVDAVRQLVQDQSSKMQVYEDGLNKKMIQAMDNREEHMKKVQEKLQEHAKHCEDVRRQKRQDISTSNNENPSKEKASNGCELA